MTSTETSQKRGVFAWLRGFAVRSGVGAVMIAVIALSLWLCHWVLVALIAAFMALAVHELASAAALHGHKPPWVVVAIGGAGLLIVEYGGWLGDIFTVGFIGCALLILVVMAWRLRGPVEGYMTDVGIAALMIAYLPLLLTFVMAIMRGAHPVGQMATLITVTVLGGDSGAYIVGSFIGRHKLAPHISPAKTWEGIGGAIVFAGVAGTLLGIFVLGAPWWQGALLGVVLGGIGAIGDLVESAIKRDVGVKDMGKLLPGHGGAMDRLDSILFCAPFAWAIMNLWMAQA